jgi:cellulose synthase/poly-beta-1,6-N-acetylglucosamine synthase-like glycosyltransferase
MRPLASLVITAHNAADSIRPCLEAVVANAGLTADEYEIILVDDRSTDGTGAAAAALRISQLVLLRIDTYVQEGLTARQAALDAGFRAARGAYVFVTDADGLVPPGWIRGALQVFERTGAAAVAGAVEFVAPRGALGRFQTVDVVFYLGLCRFLNGLGLASGVLFGNFAFRRVVYERLGGFATLGFSLTEDLTFSRGMHALRLPVAYRHDEPVRVRACEGLAALVQRSLRVSRGGASVLAALIGIWMAGLVVPASLALIGTPYAGALLALRYAIGAALTAVPALSSRRAYLLPSALLYEPAVIALGLTTVAVRIWRREVAWGGIIYED